MGQGEGGGGRGERLGVNERELIMNELVTS